ncbi:MAG: glucosamine-6-phosphate deaminase [Spirochaetaceae bacterium]|jgi:glucosamine-6-phosphate deaminase|nr:glucosamine-6-phosphate deaminase [Spirochaetaceae bacterium]
MRLIVQRDYECAARWAAEYIANRIRTFHGSGRTFQERDKNFDPDRPFVLGLPTGSSPLGIYRYLVRFHREGTLSFSRVATFNMDEYVGLGGNHPHSYRRFMWDNFFEFIDIPRQNIHLLDGLASDPEAECAAYEAAIASLGGIDLFVGGMGEDGHIAFNEPGSSLSSRTRIKTLTPETRLANARFFDGNPEKVPPTALTVGVGTVMDAREVLIIVSGYRKARALQACVEGGINHMWTLSCIQTHPRGIIVCDEAAADELKVRTLRYFRRVEGEEIP